jgi:hypothetical protein
MDRDELREMIARWLYERDYRNNHIWMDWNDASESYMKLADEILSLLAPELDKLKRLQREAHLLAMFILQSPYYKDPDVREAVDNVLGLTMTNIIKGEVKDA